MPGPLNISERVKIFSSDRARFSISHLSFFIRGFNLEVQRRRSRPVAFGLLLFTPGFSQVAGSPKRSGKPFKPGYPVSPRVVSTLQDQILREWPSLSVVLPVRCSSLSLHISLRLRGKLTKRGAHLLLATSPQNGERYFGAGGRTRHLVSSPKNCRNIGSFIKGYCCEHAAPCEMPNAPGLAT